MSRCYVFDIDGTLADCSHRRHHVEKMPKDWDAFFAECVRDKPICAVVKLALQLSLHHPLVYVSGRPERLRQKTVEWLSSQLLFVTHMYMRADGDYRDDAIIKREILDRMRADGWEPIMVFEDRTCVVKMWREAGVPCAQVAEGDF